MALGLTQTQLAERARVSNGDREISHWENGGGIPVQGTFRRLCQVLKPDLPEEEAVKAIITEADQLGSKLGGGVGGFSRPADFACSFGPLPTVAGARLAGREDLIQKLDSMVVRSRGAVLLSGSGGFGKTQLAADVALDDPGRFPGGVFWVDAVRSRPEQFAHMLAHVTGTPTDFRSARRDPATTLRKIELELQRRSFTRGRVLWVLDGHPEPPPGTAPDSVWDWCPKGNNISVIVTSRLATVDPDVMCLPVLGLDVGGSTAVLGYGLPGGSIHAEQGQRVFTWVGGHPLSLVILNRCLAAGGVSMEEVLLAASRRLDAKFLDEAAEALRHHLPANSVRGVCECLMLSHERLTDSAKVLLSILAHFASSALPWCLVEAIKEATREARAELTARSFVTPLAPAAFGMVHEVVAAFARATRQQDSSLEVAVRTLAGALLPAQIDEQSGVRRVEDIDLLMPHAHRIMEVPLAVDAHYFLAVEICRICRGRGRAREVIQLAERVVSFAEQRLGAGSTAHVNARVELASCLTSVGRTREALRLFDEVRAAGAAGGSPAAEYTFEVAEALRASGNRAAGIAALRDSLDAKIANGAPSQEVLMTMSDINTLMADDEAELDDVASFFVAASLGMRVVGAGDTRYGAQLTHNAGASLSAQGRTQAAGPYLEAAAASRERVLGAAHPDTLRSKRHLAANLYKARNFTEAVRQQREIVTLCETHLGRRASDTIVALNDLANTTSMMGRYEEAVPIMLDAIERALAGDAVAVDVLQMFLNLGEMHLYHKHPERAVSALLEGSNLAVAQGWELDANYVRLRIQLAQSRRVANDPSWRNDASEALTLAATAHPESVWHARALRLAAYAASERRDRPGVDANLKNAHRIFKNCLGADAAETVGVECQLTFTAFTMGEAPPPNARALARVRARVVAMTGTADQIHHETDTIGVMLRLAEPEMAAKMGWAVTGNRQMRRAAKSRQAKKGPRP